MHRRPSLLVLAALSLACVSCSWSWPTVIRSSPREPLFHSGFPLVGAMRMDAAVCSLVSVGPDVTLLVRPPEPMREALSLAEVCGGDAPPGVGLPVRVETSLGPVDGYVFPASRASGVLVAFTGLGMPAKGWINTRVGELAWRTGRIAFAQVRDESARPIWFDPVREARRGLEVAQKLAANCGVPADAELAFFGVSMGGWEALLATREARHQGLPARATVLDPVLDIRTSAKNLDSFWHGVDVDAIQSYFRRILAGRYGEDPPPSFSDLALRTKAHPEALSVEEDSPASWLCSAEHERYAIFLSDTDPVLGDSPRDFAERCHFPLRAAGAPGHVPLACRPELFWEMLVALLPPLEPPQGTTATGTPPAISPDSLK